MKTIRFIPPVAGLIGLLTLNSGCETATPAEQNARIENTVLGSGIVPPEQIRGYVAQTAMHSILITDQELIFGEGLYGRAQFRLPIDRIRDIRVISDGIGYGGAKYGGLSISFDVPTVKSMYSVSDRELSFDVPAFYTFEAGHMANALRAPSPYSDTGPAEALKQLLLSTKNAGMQKEPAAAGGDVEAKLKKLKQLLDDGLIDKSTYDKRSAELLRQM